MVLSFFQGLTSAEIGPSFLDLLSLTNSSLAEGSSVITAGSVGYFTGSICTGLFLQPFTNHFLMFIGVLGDAIFNITMTWCPNLILLVLVTFLRNFFSSILDTGKLMLYHRLNQLNKIHQHCQS